MSLPKKAPRPTHPLPATSSSRPLPLPSSSPTLPSRSLSSTSGIGKRYRSVLPKNFNKDPLVIVKAREHYLVTEDNRYIYDASGGAAVSCLGPGPNKRIKRAIRAQEDLLFYLNPNLMTCPVVETCADEFVATTGGKMVSCRFYSSGTAGVEAALKMVLQYWQVLKQPRTVFIGRQQSYHGISLTALAAGSHKPRREPYEAVLQEAKHAMPCDAYRGQREGECDRDYVKRLMEDMEAQIADAGADRVAGVIIEPIVGAALGCMPPVPGYLQAVRTLCNKYEIPLIFDEVMCGMGRAGKFFHAWQHENVVPDVQVTGKGMAAGHYPISALLIGKKMYDVIEQAGFFNHGQTFENFPVACAAVLELLKVIQDEGLLENVTRMGGLLLRKLKDELGDHPNVGDIRGVGLFRGLEFVRDKSTKEPFPASDAVSEGIAQMALDEFNVQFYPCGRSNGVDGDYLIIAPAFNIAEDHIDLIVTRLKDVITLYFQKYDATHGNLEAQRP